jgi:hypothetical protein
VKGMKSPVQALILLFALITLSLVSCSQNEEPKTSIATTDSPSQPEMRIIVDDAALVTDKVSTYKIDLNMTMGISAVSGNISTNGTVFTSVKAETDRLARMSHANFYMSTTVNGRTESTDYSMDMFYALPDYMYAKRTTQWTKQAYRENSITPGAKELDEQITLLKSITDSRFLRYETVDGIDHYVVDLSPDPLKATSWFLKQSIFGTESKPEDELKNLKNLTFTVWIDKSTHLLKNVNLQYSWGYDNDTDTAEVSATVKIYDYNEPLNLTPPAATIAIPPTPATSVLNK